ncbi:MAG: GNAT family N-acetyltransferase, partial [Acinetobacter sp.]
MRSPLLQSSRLNLFKFHLDDIAEIYPCVTTTLTRYMVWSPAQNLEELAQIGQKWIIAESKNTDQHFVLRHKENHLFLGLIGVHRMDSPTPEFGLWIRENYHNQGFAKEA